MDDKDFSQIKEDIGFIKGKITGIEKSLNGNIKAMQAHIAEGVEYRDKIIKHDTTITILSWLFGILTLPVLFLVVKLFAK